MKMKEGDTLDVHLHPSRELKNLWNGNRTIVLSIDGTLGTIPQKREKRLPELGIQGTIIQNLKRDSMNWGFQKNHQEARVK